MINNIVELTQKEIQVIFGGWSMQPLILTDRQKAFLDTGTGLVIFATGIALATACPPAALLINFGAGALAFWGIPQLSQYLIADSEQELKNKK